MVKSFAQPVIHAEFLADSRTLRISDKLARDLSRLAAQKALAEAQRNSPAPVSQAASQEENIANKQSRLGLRPQQVRALKFDDAMFHAILKSIAQEEIVVENTPSRPVHVVRHDVLRNLLHAKMETGWYNGSNSRSNSRNSMTALDKLSAINVSSVASTSAPLQLRSVNGQQADLAVLLGEIINRYISPALNVSKDITMQFYRAQDTLLANFCHSDTNCEAASRELRVSCKELGSKDVMAYGTAPMIFLQGMENGPPLEVYSSNQEDIWRV